MFVAAITTVSNVKLNALPPSNYSHMCSRLEHATTAPPKPESIDRQTDMSPGVVPVF
jgi:hypothetical protein